MKRFLVLVLALMVTTMACITFAQAENYYLPYQVEVITEQISLREGASTGASRLAWLPNGTVLPVIGSEGDFYQVDYCGTYGWVLKKFVVEDPEHVTFRGNTYVYAAPYSEKCIGQRSAYERYTVIGYYNEYYVISFRNATGFVKQSTPIWLDEELNGYLGCTPTIAYVANDTKIRTGPGTNWTSVKKLAAGSEIYLLAQEYGWYAILYSNAIAYIPMDDVMFVIE